ncbi:MAG TPA: copper chaperone PCu(A)C [Xanthomonadaceae bacterium]|nr:copper chaperone PCu(A)C [Xanthomonadaceae bacterium]
MDTPRIPFARPALLALAAFVLCACAREPSPAPVPAPSAAADGACLPEVREGWIRLTPGAMAMDAGFGRIVNPCATAAMVTGASSPAYADVSLHETTLEDGISRMRPVASLPVPAHGEAVLQPGGLHLMLMQPAGAREAGGTVEIAFRLEDGREVRGSFALRAANAP